MDALTTEQLTEMRARISDEVRMSFFFPSSPGTFIPRFRLSKVHLTFPWKIENKIGIALVYDAMHAFFV